MGLTNFPFGSSSFGAPLLGGLPSFFPGNVWWVGPEGRNVGDSPANAFRSIADAVLAASAGDMILIAPGGYDPTAVITIPRTKSNLTIVGLGGRGAAFIEPSTEDQAGMIVHADDVSLYNLGVAAEDETSAVALTVSGARFRAYGCKFEGGARQVAIGPGTVAQQDAGTHGDGADALFVDCELCWGTQGLVLVCTDYGAVTQLRMERCRFHNLTAASMDEAVGSGGAAGVLYRDLQLVDCTFGRLEDGTEPTAYVLLNDDNANSGYVTGCAFPSALAGGKNLVSTALLWVSNYHTGGVSTGQPS